MWKVAKYIVEETGDFGGCCVDYFRIPFDNYEDAYAYYKAEREKYAHMRGIEIKLTDGIAEAEKELAELKAKVTKLEAEIRAVKGITVTPWPQ